MLEQNQSDQQPLPLQAPPEVKSLVEQQRSLAEALGERGEVEEGVRHLERAYDLAKTDEERKEVVAPLASYRTKFNLGQLWQFVNEGGEVFYESTDVEVIRARLLDGSIRARPVAARIAWASRSRSRILLMFGFIGATCADGLNPTTGRWWIVQARPTNGPPLL